MRLPIAALVFVAAQSPTAQATPDLSAATPVSGDWSYGQTADGTEATFTNASGYPQLWVHCTRATRRVSIARTASAAASVLSIWTSSATRAAPSSFDPATKRLTVEFANFDPLLDALANSRGRIAFSIGNESALLVPPWPELARIVEDCRA